MMKTKCLLLPLLFIFAVATATAEDEEFIELRDYEPQQLPIKKLERVLKNKLSEKFDVEELTIIAALYPIDDYIDRVGIMTHLVDYMNMKPWIPPEIKHTFDLALEITIDSKTYSFSNCRLRFLRDGPRYNGVVAHFNNEHSGCISDDNSIQLTDTIYLHKDELGLRYSRKVWMRTF